MRLHPFVRYAARSNHLPNLFFTIACDCRCLYILSGSGRLFFEGAEYTLLPGTLALYPAGIPYMPLSDEKEAMEFVSINFDYTEEFSWNVNTMPPQPMEQVRPERIQRTYEDMDLPVLCNPLILPGMFEVEAILLEITEEYSRQDRYFREIGASLFGTVLFHAIRASELGSSTGRTVDRALRYIKEHFAEPIGNDDVARAFNFHSYYLNRLVKKQTGYSLHQHLLICRLNHAQHLLTSTDLSIDVVSELSGFQSAAHFSTRFRKQFGISPSKFRKDYYI